MGMKVNISMAEASNMIIREILGQVVYGIPACMIYLEGAIGIGKSSLQKQVKQYLEKYTQEEWGIIDCRLASYTATDLQGVPYPVMNSETGIMELMWIKDGSIPNQFNTSTTGKKVSAVGFGKNGSTSTSENTITEKTEDAIIAEKLKSRVVALEKTMNNQNNFYFSYYGIIVDLSTETDEVSTKVMDELNVLNEVVADTSSPNDWDAITNRLNFIKNMLDERIEKGTVTKTTQTFTPGSDVIEKGSTDTKSVSKKKFPKYGILFLDELNQVTDPNVQSLEYQLILDHKVNDMILPDTWFIIGAGNRQEDGGVYEKLKAPVRDRMKIANVGIRPQETIDYFRKIAVHPAVIGFLEDKITDKTSLVTGECGVLHNYDPSMEEYDENGENYVFTTPRTYEFVSNLLKRYEKMLESGKPELVMTEKDLRLELGSLMGSDIGSEFANFYSDYTKIPLTEIRHTDWQDDMPQSNKLMLGKLDTKQECILRNAIASTDNLEEKFRILNYMYKTNAQMNSIKIAISMLEPRERAEYTEYLKQHNCNGLRKQYENYDEVETIEI